METLRKTKIEFFEYVDKDNPSSKILKIKRDGVPELKFYGATKELGRYLEQPLHNEEDYEYYKQFIKFKKAQHLSSWLYDVLCRDKDRELANLLMNGPVRPLNTDYD